MSSTGCGCVPLQCTALGCTCACHRPPGPTPWRAADAPAPAADLLVRLASALAALVEEPTLELLAALDGVACDLYDSIDPPPPDVRTRAVAAVYQALRQHCDDHGLALVRPSRLARAARCNTRTAKRALRALERRALLVRMPSERRSPTTFLVRDARTEAHANRVTVLLEILRLSDEIEVAKDFGILEGLADLALAAARVESAVLRRPLDPQAEGSRLAS